MPYSAANSSGLGGDAMSMIYTIVLLLLGWTTTIAATYLCSETMHLASIMFFVGAMICHSISALEARK